VEALKLKRQYEASEQALKELRESIGPKTKVAHGTNQDASEPASEPRGKAP
jgi:hypothetical protein